MPRRKTRTTRTSSNRDIEAVREVITSGVPWLAPDRHRELTPGLTLEQRALLGNLTPYRSAAKFICDLDPNVLELARLELKADIAAAKGKWGPIAQQTVSLAKASAAEAAKRLAQLPVGER